MNDDAHVGDVPSNYALPAPLKRSEPVWVAPMAGGASCPALVIAAAEVGHFAQLAAGYKSAAAMVVEIQAVRAAGTGLFGVNLFTPNVHPIAEQEYARYAETLQSDALRLGVTDYPAPLTEDNDDWDAKIAALIDDPVPLVSFTFGLPTPNVVEVLHGAGSLLMQTVTSVDEARRAEDRGVDMLIVQGFAAGGHSGIWHADVLPPNVPLARLIADVRAAVTLPIIASGGIATPEDVRIAHAAGASAVAVGTAVLCSDESGASQVHKDAIVGRRYTSTALTRAFTGRPARALVNRFVSDHDDAPSGYPALHHLTRPLRTAATTAVDPSALHLWAGQSWRLARTGPVATILRQLTTGSSGHHSTLD